MRPCVRKMERTPSSSFGACYSGTAINRVTSSADKIAAAPETETSPRRRSPRAFETTEERILGVCEMVRCSQLCDRGDTLKVLEITTQLMIANRAEIIEKYLADVEGMEKFQHGKRDSQRRFETFKKDLSDFRSSVERFEVEDCM